MEPKQAESPLAKRTTSSLTRARDRAKTEAIERKAKLAAWNDYIGFGVSKIAGISAIGVGALEYLDPNFLTVVVPRPGWLVGAGLALLTGRSVVSLIARLDRRDK